MLTVSLLICAVNRGIKTKMQYRSM